MMAPSHRLALFAMLFMVSACTSTVEVPTAQVNLPAGMQPIEGQYAAHIQTGGWQLETSINGMDCAIWGFESDIDDRYVEAFEQSLQKSLAHVEFLPAALSPQQIADGGYDALILVHQGGAASNAAVGSQFFALNAQGSMELDVIVAISSAQGIAYQASIQGKGVSSKTVHTCPAVGEAVGEAGTQAIGQVVERSTLHIRDHLLSAER